MADLRLRFLGPAEIYLDGDLVHLDRRNSLALLAYLVLSGRTRTREELALLLGDDIAEATARKRLRNALADLVDHGLGSFLHVTRQTVAFKTDMSIRFDVHELEAIAALGESADVARLQWATELCDREVLAGLSLRDASEFELWLIEERERCNRLLQSIAETLLLHYERQGALDAGIALGHRLLVAAPWNEAIHRTLMRLLSRDGQVGAALQQYKRCCDALADELGVAPQTETTVLFERLQSERTAPWHNLPLTTLEANAFLGREEQRASLVARLVDPSCRLLSLVGLGGSGKTCLALAAAAQLAQPVATWEEHPFADGIVQVDLTEIVDGDGSIPRDQRAEEHVATSIGFALGMAFYGKIDRLSQLVAYLEPKHMLFIVNNMELALSGASALQAILQQTRNVTLLVTSRIPIGLPNGWTQELGGLRIPERADEVGDAPASRLFLREAVHAGVAIDEAEFPDVVAICRLTGGSPLALKIASGWLGSLSCAEIAHELRQGGELLDEMVPNRHVGPASIRSIVTSAFEALPTREQAALTRLAVFPGRFDRRAAAAVGVTTPGLVMLHQRGLLERVERDGYMLHPLVSQFAAEQLAGDAELAAEAHDLHATYYTALVAEVSPELHASPQAYTKLGGEKENVRAAWEWAARQRETELLTLLLEGLSLWHHRAGLHQEWTQSLDTAIDPLRATVENRESRSILVQLLVAKAESLLWQGNLDNAFSLLREARACIDTTDMIQFEASISFCEGRLLRFRGDQTVAAEGMLQQARAIAQTTSQRRIEANSLLQLGFSATDREDYQAATNYVARAETIFQDIGDRLAQARTTNHLGRLAVFRGDYTEAQLSLEEGLQFAEAFGDRFLESYTLMYLGIVYDVAFGRHRDAKVHFDRALAIANQTGDPYLDGNISRAAGRNALHMGAFASAELAFAHALQRARDVTNTRAIADSLRCMAQVTLEMGDYDAAHERAQQSLYLAEVQERQHASASTCLILGRVYERQRRYSDAAAAYSRTLNIATMLGIPYLRCDAITGLASVSLVNGDASMAVQYVEEVLPYLYRSELAGCEEPGWVSRTCIETLAKVGDSRTADVLRHSWSLLDRRSMALPETQRSRFLLAFADRRFVLQQWSALPGGSERGDHARDAQLVGPASALLDRLHHAEDSQNHGDVRPIRPRHRRLRRSTVDDGPS